MHRNNAAEWAMTVVIAPAVWAVRLWMRIGRRR